MTKSSSNVTHVIKVTISRASYYLRLNCIDITASIHDLKKFTSKKEATDWIQKHCTKGFGLYGAIEYRNPQGHPVEADVMFMA
jgi:hypothetical protein